MNTINRRKFIKKMSGLLSGMATVLKYGTGLALLQSCAEDSTSPTASTAGTSTPSTQTFNALPVLENTTTSTAYALPTMTIRDKQHDFGNGVQSTTIGVETTAISSTYGGPIIRVTKGDTVEFNLMNSLSEITSNHWHGLHIIGQIDGTPHQPIAVGNTWNIKMKIQQEASTNWYHSHEHGRTQQLVNKGHVGFFIIEDEHSKALAIPQTLNVDDFPMIAKHAAFQNNGQIALTGISSPRMTINGKIGSLLLVEKKWIRIRVLNGSDGEVSKLLNFKLSDGRTFYKIATDGGFLDKPVAITNCRMAPGERNEFLINFTGDGVGSQVILQAAPTTGGGAGTEQAYENMMTFEVKNNDSGAAGITSFDVTKDLRGNSANFSGAAPSDITPKINWATVAANAATLRNNPNVAVAISVRIGIPPAPNTIQYECNTANTCGTSEDILTTAPSSYVAALVGGPANETVSMDANKVNFSVKKNIWQVWNFKSANHPLHIHGCSFLILNRNGEATLPEEDRGWKDVIYPFTGGGDSKILIKFDYHTYSQSVANGTTNPNTVQASTYSGRLTTASTDTSLGTIGTGGTISKYDPYMLHCHFLHHEDGGMMGQFNVVTNTQTI